MSNIVEMLKIVLKPEKSYIMTCVSDSYHDKWDHRYDDHHNRGPGKGIISHDVEYGGLIGDVLFYKMKDFYAKEEKLPRNALFIKVDDRMVGHILPDSKEIAWKMKSPALENYVSEKAEILQDRIFKHMREVRAAELAQNNQRKQYEKEFGDRFGL